MSSTRADRAGLLAWLAAASLLIAGLIAYAYWMDKYSWKVAQRRRRASAQIGMVRSAIRMYQDDHGVAPYSPLGGERALRLLVDCSYLDTDAWLRDLDYLNSPDLKIPEDRPRVMLIETTERLDRGRIYYVTTEGDIGVKRARARRPALGDPVPPEQ